jgi:hypothetical protein
MEDHEEEEGYNKQKHHQTSKGIKNIKKKGL